MPPTMIPFVGTFRHLDDTALTGTLVVREVKPWVSDGYAAYFDSELSLVITAGILPGTGADPGTPYQLVAPGYYQWSLKEGSAVYQTWRGLWPTGAAETGTATGGGSASGLPFLEDSGKTWTIGQWVGGTLTDSTTATFTVLYSDSTRIYVSGGATPASGAYTLTVERDSGTTTDVDTCWAEDSTKAWATNVHAGRTYTDTGASFAILSNTAIRLTLIGGVTPDGGAYTISEVASGTSSAVGTVSSRWLDDSTQTWTPDQWIGYYLEDGDGDVWAILDNSATRLYVAGGSSTPSGAYLIRATSTAAEVDLVTYLPTLVPTANQGHRVIVGGKLLLPDLTPCDGWTVRFTPQWSYLIDAAAGAIIVPVPVEFETESTGALPSGCYVWANASYTVVVEDAAGAQRFFGTITLGSYTRDTAISLTTLIPLAMQT